jgi:hypothetical protein
MKTSFRDRHERLKYLKACETARRIVGDPSLTEQARRFVEAAMAPDPHQRAYTLIWRELPGLPADAIAAALLEDSDRGQLLRDTSPVFGKGFTSREVVELRDRDRAAWQSAATNAKLCLMDTADPVSGESADTPHPETEVERWRRLAWEAKGIAEARAQLDAGFYVDAGEVDAWIDSIGTDHELPPPPTRRR